MTTTTVASVPPLAASLVTYVTFSSEITYISTCPIDANIRPVCRRKGTTGERHVDASAVPNTQTKVMLIAGDPGQAFHLAAIPNQGVGLARLEFIVSNHIGIHPMALAHFPNLRDAKALNEIRTRIGDEDPREFFVRRLSEGVARIAAAFYPKPVVVRTSDFKTNEYAPDRGWGM